MSHGESNADANELRVLQKEWRESVTEALRELRVQGARTLTRMDEIQEQCATKSDMQAVTARVSSIEGDRAKVIGGIVVLQAVGTVLLFIINKVWKE